MIKRLCKLLLVLFIVISGLIGFILESKQGLNLALLITKKVIPGQLTYQNAQGKLGSKLSLNKVTYKLNTMFITVDNIKLQWHWWSLLTSLETPLNLRVDNVKLIEAGTPNVTTKLITIEGLLSINKQSNLKTRLDKIIYIASPESQITASDILILITGNYNDYNINAHLKTKGTNLPDVTWQLLAEGTTQQLNKFHLNGKLLNGTIDLTSQLKWSPSLTWNALLVGQNLQPEQTWPNVPGKLQFKINSTGSLNEKSELSTTLNIQDISGRLMNNPLLAKGSLQYKNKIIAINHFSFTSTQNTLRANGTIAQKANLKITANLPALGQFLPTLSGNITLDANISGQGNNPYISALLNMKQLKMPQVSLQSASLNIQGNVLPPNPLTIKISASNLQSGEHIFHSIEAELLRKNNVFSLSTIAKGNKINATIKASAQQVKDMIKGQVNTLSISGQDNPIISTRSPIQFQVSPSQIVIIPNCLYTKAGKTCIEKFNVKKDDDKLNGDIQLTANDFSYLADFSPQLENPKGHLSVNTHISGTVDKPILTGNSTLNASVSIPYLKIALNPIAIKVTGDSQGKLKYTGSITTNTALRIDGETDLLNDFITNIKVNANNFQVINNDEANVKVSPTLNIAYKDQTLNITGNIDIPYAKITPVDFTSTVTLPSDVVIVSDKKSEEVPLNVFTKITISLGDKINFDYAGLTAKLSGGLTVQDNPGGDTTATGILTVDKGQYKAYGQDLTIRDGKLIYTGGSVANPGLNIKATRTIKVVSTGSSSGPSDASSSASSYQSTQQLVGIKLEGNLDQPKLTLFSDPSGLSQSDILSYIVLGRASGSASGADAGSLLSALSLLDVGSHSESNIKNQLNQSLGLDVDLGSEQEYDEDSGSVVNNTSLSLGKSLSSKLYLSYSIGIVVPINILTITYKLTKALSLRSQSSAQGAGVDVFYHYSRD